MNLAAKQLNTQEARALCLILPSVDLREGEKVLSKFE